MSLTSHLARRSSPIRSWFERSLGNTRVVVSAANDELCGTPSLPCTLKPPASCDVGLVGIAVDYLVRATLRPGALEKTVATSGASALGHTGLRLEREAVVAIEQLEPCQTALPTKP